MLHIFAYDKRKKSVLKIPTKSLGKINKKNSFIWVDVMEANWQELALIQKHFRIHPLTIEDCSNEHTRAKIEEYRDYTFIVLQAIGSDEKDIKLREIDFILGKNFLITTHFRSFPKFEEMKKPKQLKRVLSKGCDYLLHELVDGQIDNYVPIVEAIDKKIDGLANEVFQGAGKSVSHLNDIFQLKREVIHLRRGVYPQKEIITHLVRKKTPFIGREVSLYFRDVLDHMTKVVDMLDSSRELISDAFDANLSASSNKLNEVMKVLTVIATIMMPLTLITGIFGMNFRVMPELDWRYGFQFTIVSMIVIALTMILFFKKKGWLNSDPE